MAGNWHRIGNISGRDGVGVPQGGAQGEVLIKEGGTDFATAWRQISYEEIAGKVPASALPQISNEPYVVDSESAMLNLPAVPGRMAIRTDEGKTFVLSQLPASTLENWVELTTTSDVQSVNSKTGNVVLTKADVGLDKVNNTADADKPQATASTPGLMSAADKKKLDDATASATANRVVLRDANGRTALRQLSLTDAPSAATHAVTKNYADGLVADRFKTAITLNAEDLDTITAEGVYRKVGSAHISDPALHYPPGSTGAGVLLVTNYSTTGIIQEWTTWGGGVTSSVRRWIRNSNNSGGAWTGWRELAGTELATTTANGLMSAAHKALLDTAANGATANSLVRRNSAGRFNAAEPTSDGQVANKGYVDGKVSTVDGRVNDTNSRLDAEITRISGGLTVGAEDFVGIPQKSRTVIVEGAPFGSPHVKASTFNGITKDQVWKVEETALGLGYATQRWTLVSCIATEQHMIGFAWERTWIPGESRWSGYTCVAGDTGVLVSRAFKAGGSNFEPGKPWRTRESRISSTPADSTEILYSYNDFPRVRRIGPTVTVSARFKPGGTANATAIASNQGLFVISFLTSICMKFWIDETAAVGAASQVVNAATNANRWRSHIYNARSSNGRFEIRASRYGPSTPAAGTWLPMNMSWAAPVPVTLTRENAVDPDALPDIDEGGEDAPIPDEEG